MKKVLPYLLHILCFIALALPIMLFAKFVLQIDLASWHIAIIAALITLIAPQFKNVETQSGTKLQVKWRFNSARK